MTGDIELLLPGFGSGVSGDSSTLMSQARWEQCVAAHLTWEQWDAAARCAWLPTQRFRRSLRSEAARSHWDGIADAAAARTQARWERVATELLPMCDDSEQADFAEDSAEQRNLAIDAGVALLDFGESLPASQPAGWDARRWAAASVAERREWFELDRLARTELGEVERLAWADAPLHRRRAAATRWVFGRGLASHLQPRWARLSPAQRQRWMRTLIFGDCLAVTRYDLTSILSRPLPQPQHQPQPQP